MLFVQTFSSRLEFIVYPDQLPNLSLPALKVIIYLPVKLFYIENCVDIQIAITYFYSLGWARKPQGKVGKQKTGAVETQLRELFNQGLTPDGKVDKARKVSARLAAQKMKDMVAAGKFHHEDLLSYTQIQSWFGHNFNLSPEVDYSGYVHFES